MSLFKRKKHPKIVAITLVNMAAILTELNEHFLAANVWAMLRDYSEKQITDYEAKKVEMP